ncbi:hypothetical protein M0L17_21900 [Bacillaceae bacterium OS4b]|nr:hypothetical protein [Bacillaceae bacterium OS4b]
METYQRKMNHNRDEYRKLRWKQHRIQVTGLFDAVFSKKAFVDKVAIVGAGNCDDLDIEYLATKCNSYSYLILIWKVWKRVRQICLNGPGRKFNLLKLM